jgi:uncharacterized protein YodC (DUF2158 family)
MAEKFMVGDLVRHKTGGPTMVVTGYTYGMVKCWWPGKTHHGQDFTEETLEPAQHEASASGIDGCEQKTLICPHPSLLTSEPDAGHRPDQQHQPGRHRGREGTGGSDWGGEGESAGEVIKGQLSATASSR